MNRRLNSLTAAALLALTLSGGLRAEDTGRAGESGAFLRMGLGARYLAMGGLGAALSTDAMALYHNPAGLAFQRGRNGAASLRHMSLDRRLTYIGYGQSVGPEEAAPGVLQAGLGLGWISAGVSDIDGRDISGQHTDWLYAGEHAFCFGFAIRPMPQLALGVTGKLVYSRLGGVKENGDALTARGFGFDVGLMLKPVEGLTLGAVLKDLRTAYTWDTQDVFDMGSQTSAPFPKRVEAGASYTVAPWQLLVLAGVEKIDGRPARLHAGLEWKPAEIVALRAGLRNGQPAMGVGARLEKDGRFFHFDYAMVTSEVAPSSDHLISWAVWF